MSISKMSYSLTQYRIVLYIFVAVCIRHAAVQSSNASFFGDALEGLFEKREFPIPGGLPVLNRKIFRGLRVTIAEHPYVVSVRRLTAHYITGTLLTKNLVITVAHPLHGISIADLGVVVGENYSDRGTMLFTVVLLVFHEDFDPYAFTNDLVLLRLYEDIHYRVTVKPIMLAYELKSMDGETAFVTGWGRCDRIGTELCLPKSTRFYRNEKLDPMLRTVKFTFHASNKHCLEYDSHELKINSGMLCVGPARLDDILCPCMAVPGAPLVIDGQLAGLQSWGFGCGYLQDLPIIYTNVEYYKRWIVHNIPILRSITRENLTHLYYGTKVNQITKYLYESRAQFFESKTMRGNQDMQPLWVDYKLAQLRGNLYDIRDFIDEGKFHEEKRSLYQVLKQSEHRQDEIREIESRYSVRDSVPFLSDKTLNGTGLQLTNGTLGDEDDDSDSSYTDVSEDEPEE